MNELAQRLFDFSVRSLKLTSNLSNTPEFKVIRYQLAKSATSSGANYEESQAGSSR
ncbi:MAG: four helix bundle protein, partial [Candidatus Marinimicrobia bacterium]|nr:four helix bundle protein [Candidatus Neomarinimicrobiota bacterium]